MLLEHVEILLSYSTVALIMGSMTYFLKYFIIEKVGPIINERLGITTTTTDRSKIRNVQGVNTNIGTKFDIQKMNDNNNKQNDNDKYYHELYKKYKNMTDELNKKIIDYEEKSKTDNIAIMELKNKLEHTKQFLKDHDNESTTELNKLLQRIRTKNGIDSDDSDDSDNIQTKDRLINKIERTVDIIRHNRHNKYTTTKGKDNNSSNDESDNHSDNQTDNQTDNNTKHNHHKDGVCSECNECHECIELKEKVGRLVGIIRKLQNKLEQNDSSKQTDSSDKRCEDFMNDVVDLLHLCPNHNDHEIKNITETNDTKIKGELIIKYLTHCLKKCGDNKICKTLNNVIITHNILVETINNKCHDHEKILNDMMFCEKLNNDCCAEELIEVIRNKLFKMVILLRDCMNNKDNKNDKCDNLSEMIKLIKLDKKYNHNLITDCIRRYDHIINKSMDYTQRDKDHMLCMIHENTINNNELIEKLICRYNGLVKTFDYCENDCKSNNCYKCHPEKVNHILKHNTKICCDIEHKLHETIKNHNCHQNTCSLSDDSSLSSNSDKECESCMKCHKLLDEIKCLKKKNTDLMIRIKSLKEDIDMVSKNKMIINYGECKDVKPINMDLCYLPEYVTYFERHGYPKCPEDYLNVNMNEIDQIKNKCKVISTKD